MYRKRGKQRTTGGILKLPSRKKEARVYLVPTAEQSDHGTDIDSDNSDTPDGIPLHLPHRLLRGPGVLDEGSGNEDTNDNDPKEWRQKDAGLLGTKIPECVPKKLSNVDQNLLENCSTAVDYYEVFLGQQYTEEIVKQSKLYAVHRGFNSHIVNISGKDN